MKVLGLDFGTKRIGYAVGDTKTCMAFGRDVFVNDEATMVHIKKLCQAEKIEYIVIGLPRSLDGDADLLEYEARDFGDRIADSIQLPVAYEDERFTSKISEGVLRQQNISSREQKGKVDVLAAQRILQQWLDKNAEEV